MSETDAMGVGVCVFEDMPRNRARSVTHGDYVLDMLRHVGLCFEGVAPAALDAALDRLGVLVTVGHASWDEARRDRLADWVRGGGTWLSVGGTCGCDELLGVEMAAPRSPAEKVRPLGEGYLAAPDASPPHRVLEHARIPLHYFGGLAARATSATVLGACLDAHQRPTRHVGLTSRAVGSGLAMLLAVDVPGSVLRIQQGMPVAGDGVGAPDGSAPIEDGVLKAEDGMVLDWSFDRQPVPGVAELSAFLEPVADHWRHLLVRCVLHLAEARRQPVAMLWLYPDDLPALGHLSFDSDGNDPAHAAVLLERLREAQVQATWCTLAPGYDPDTTRSICEAGHEPAMHYDALDHPWSEPEFDRQYQALRTCFGQGPTANKNHYIRWEGGVEFFRWCARRGIRVDQSRSGSKLGATGFTFGTCHPFRPVAPDGERIDILELPTLTWDLVNFAPPELVDPLIDAVSRSHGVLHWLFHPAHTHRAEVGDAMVDLVRRARSAGLAWWTSERINRWERARLAARWTSPTGGAGESGETAVQLHLTQPMPGARVLWLGGGGDPRVNGAPVEGRSVTRFGFDFISVPLGEGATGTYALTG